MECSDTKEAYGEAHRPGLTYREGDDFRAWQREFRQGLEELRGPTPERVEPEVEVLERVELSDHQRVLIRFSVTRFSRVVAYLQCKAGADFEYVLHTRGHQLAWDSAEPFLRERLGLNAG